VRGGPRVVPSGEMILGAGVSREIDELRALARARHKAATRKVSRLNTRHDVAVSGTEFDPRRDLSKVKRYTSAQLSTYIAELSRFVSRQTQYVGDVHRKPMRAQDWRKYQEVEAIHNAQVSSKLAPVKDIKLPNQDQTLGEWLEGTKPKHRSAAQLATNTPQEIKRSPRQIGSAGALKKLIKDLKNKNSPGYAKRQLDDARAQYRKMAQRINNPGLSAATDKLTDEQFSVLWNYTNFATAVSLDYDAALKMMSNKEAPWHSQILEDQVKDAYQLASWAQSLDLGSGLRDNNKRR